MNRYRSYNPLDDQPLEEGDAYFTGVNAYDAAENLAKGEVQWAINTDFSKAGASTRGGFVCLPALGATQFGTRSWIVGKSPASNQYRCVTFGNNLFVATSIDGTGNRVMTSPDGITWTARTSAADNQWYGVTYGNGMFVAVAGSGTGNRVMTSPDGITWTIQTSAADNVWVSVAYGAGVFCAVSNDGGAQHVMTSPDGLVWTMRNSAADLNWTSVIFANSMFVAVASTGSGNRVMTSSDGITWSSQTSAADNQWTNLAYGNSTFVAIAQSGTGNRVMTSTNGTVWTVRTSAADKAWWGIAYGNGMFVVTPNDGSQVSMVSPDGITWSTINLPSVNQWFSVAYGNRKFVSVAASGYLDRTMSSGPSVWGSGTYSDPNSPSMSWIVTVGMNKVGFFSFGQTSRSIAYPANYTVTSQSTIVQANNYLFVFPGTGQTPIYWDGNWSGAFVTVPNSTLGVGYTNIPQSNQATFSQNRLWVINGKDTISASNILDFTNYNVLTGAFNLNIGSSDYLITSYPFGYNSLVVFKNKSVFALQGTQATITSVTNTEITRQIGIIGINACVSVGPDVVYMSDRNITTIRLNLQNNLQAVTMPLSRNITPVFDRVNWAYAYKVAMGYWNNQLFVALPLDNSTVCNTILVYNFITEHWYGEWNFAASIDMNIQNFVVANYLGQIRLHVVTEDGRIFVFEGGQNDISGTTVAEIATSITTRAYRMDNNSKVPRRMYMDASTNRPQFSVTAYSEGASESSVELSNQTYLRSQSWVFNDSAYVMDNTNNDYNRAFRKDYSTGPNSIKPGTGFLPEMPQAFRLPLITRRKGRLSWFKIDNTTGFILVNGIGVETRPGDRSSFTQV